MSLESSTEHISVGPLINISIVYLLNMDSLGGYKNGPGQTDAVIQTIEMPSTGSQPGPPFGAIFGTVGSYPLPETQGGYIYVKPTTISGPVGTAIHDYDLKLH